MLAVSPAEVVVGIGVVAQDAFSGRLILDAPDILLGLVRVAGKERTLSGHPIQAAFGAIGRSVLASLRWNSLQSASLMKASPVHGFEAATIRQAGRAYLEPRHRPGAGQGVRGREYTFL